MNWEAVKNNKVLKWGLIIAVPSVIVVGYFGYKYLKNRNENAKMKLNPDGSIDTTGMDYYRISSPFIGGVAGKIYDAISKIGYSLVGDKVIRDNKGVMIAVIELMAKPESAEKIKKVLPLAGKDVTIEKITKEQSLVLPKEYSCTKHEEGTLSNINDFYEDAKCLEWKTMYGYDIMALKDIPNIDKILTIEELDKILGYAKIGANKLTNEQALDFMAIMQKAYNPIT